MQMLFKVAYRNAVRSMKEYFTYFLTMTIVSGLMFAFSTMIFSEDIKKLSEMASMMGVILLIATLVIIFIVAWLINYMVSFVLEKKSREFATYMLLGINRKKISEIYICENIVIGIVSLFIGILVGILVKQGLVLIFYKIMGSNLNVNINFNISSLLFTLAGYCGCYFIALLRNQKKFKKMTIHSLINMDKENEQLHERGERLKQWLLPVSILYIGSFIYNVFKMRIHGINIWVFTCLFILAFYCMFIGISSGIVCYIRKKKNGIYHNATLFILRQFSSKVKTMNFTMGTVGLLLTVSLLGSTVALMLNDFQNNQMKEGFPFDVSIHRATPGYTFQEEKRLLEDEVGISDACIYQVYNLKSHTMNDFFYSNLNFFNDRYKGKSDIVGDKYYKYDTFIKLSDYNHLRKMLGYNKVDLNENEYLLQTKERLEKEIGEMAKEIKIKIDDHILSLKCCSDIPFCQNGHNGTDYILVIPDKYFSKMLPYYSQMAVKTLHVPDNTLWAKLSEMNKDRFEAVGTDLIMYSDNTLFSNIAITEMKFVLTFLIFPLFYIGIVFLCVALTVLAVQQLSDSTKYKFRYKVLIQLGQNEKQISLIILRQLAYFYLCPVLLAVVVGFPIAISVSSKFVSYTGVHTAVSYYYTGTLIFLGGLYFIYFIVTYLEFKKNIFHMN